MSRLEATAEMLAKLDDVLNNPGGRRVGLLGLGVAGREMARNLVGRGATVIGADRREDLADPELEGLELRLGEAGAETFADVELLVISPGADPRQPAVQAVIDRGVPVCGELELVGHVHARVAAITGTNGKSTTTALLGALLRAAGQTAFVGGNLGEPVIAWRNRGDRVDAAVLELSSFQLETAYRFSADVAVVLNLAPDHGERYATHEDYVLAKQRLVENLEPGAVAVLNHDDERVRAMADVTRARIFWLSTVGPVSGDGASVAGDTLHWHGALDGDPVDLSHPRLMGAHNRQNALAAWLAARAMGMSDLDALARGYLAFGGLSHRLEWVDEIAGVAFVNDSKATNDEAAAVALRAMDRPVVLLCGGRDKGAGYAALRAAAQKGLRAVIAYGEARETLAEAFAGEPRVELHQRVTLEEAFATANELARAGDVVLLAPACASFDQFPNFAARGDAFKALVVARGGRDG